VARTTRKMKTKRKVREARAKMRTTREKVGCVPYHANQAYRNFTFPRYSSCVVLPLRGANLTSGICRDLPRSRTRTRTRMRTRTSRWAARSVGERIRMRAPRRRAAPRSPSHHLFPTAIQATLLSPRAEPDCECSIVHSGTRRRLSPWRV
jgi:hypothetical protein